MGTGSNAHPGLTPDGIKPERSYERVRTISECERASLTEGDDATAQELIPQTSWSPLSLSVVTIAPNRSAVLGRDPAIHELVYVLEGDLQLQGDGEVNELPHQTAFLHTGNQGRATVSAINGTGATLAVYTAAPSCDEHAALGERTPSVRLDLDHADIATGKRSFQVLLGPENSCCRATMFMGVVPPGAAPWHFHQYDEIVMIVRGSGTYHQAGGGQPTAPGSAVRIPPRTVHINENQTDSDMHVLGVFTPAGSPAAAFLAADPTA